MKQSPSYHVMFATLADAAAISQLICSNTDQVTANAYSDAQKEAWKKANTPASIRKQMELRQILCCSEESVLVGVIGLKDQEVVGLYVHPDHLRKGIGQYLLVQLEEYARDTGLLDLFLFATPAGYPFYLRNGYQPIEEEDVIVNEVVFRETKMHKRLI